MKPYRSDLLLSDPHNFSGYSLQYLLEETAPHIIHAKGTFMDVLGILRFPEVKSGDMIVIGISGPAGVGKTEFTKALAAMLHAQDVPVATLELDWFLTNRSSREALVDDIAAGRCGIAHVTHASWDMTRYVRALKAMKAQKTGTLHLEGTYDRLRGICTASVDVSIPMNGYLFVEGVAIMDGAAERLVDYHIRFDVADDYILLDRALARERTKPAAYRILEATLRRRFEVMLFQHTQYLRMISRAHNHCIIDVSDLQHIQLFANPI